jgi:hypothetical protein
MVEKMAQAKIIAPFKRYVSQLDGCSLSIA